MRTLSGVFPVLCTPFREDGQIDTDEFRAIIRFVLECGADGCVFPGVASEVETLSAEERGELVAILADVLGGQVPFIAGASEASPDSVLARIAEGASAGASAAMVMAPAQLGDDISAHTAFFRSVASGASLPVILQNAPSPIGAGLKPAQVASIARTVEAVRYVKEETLPCGQNITAILTSAQGDIDGAFGGAGGRHITDELARGSLGTMPACELTDLHVRLVRAWRQGHEAEARRLFMISMPLLNFQAVFRMQMTKATLRRRGIITNTQQRGKGPRLDVGDHAELNALLDQIKDELTQYIPSVD